MNKRDYRRNLLIQAKNSCIHQEDLSIDSIKRYMRAIDYVSNIYSYITVQDIINLGKIISKKNNGFRCTPVTFQNGNSGAHYAQIHRLIENLCLAKKEYRISDYDFYKEFESIHPFNDGNGRVGEILTYYLTGYFKI